MSEVDNQNKAAAGIGGAAGAGAFAGVVAGLAAHYLGGGRPNFWIFLIVAVLLLGHLKGINRFVGLAVLSMVAVAVISIFRE